MVPTFLDMSDPLKDSKYQRSSLLLIGAVLLFRLLYAAIFPVNPVGDEAYYWDWGRQLDYGYYSKPPLIAWLYACLLYTSPSPRDED